MTSKSVRLFLTGLLSAALLSGCSSDAKKGLCPTAAILASTSTLTVFRPGAQGDPTGELYRVGMTDVSTDCSFDKHELTTDSSVDITFRATRAPSGDGAQYSVPYFVVVSQGDRIINKHMFVAQFSFDPGRGTATFQDSVASTFITLDRGKRPADYEVLIGLQLTQQQIDYNKKMGRYGP
jgi:hypothetical protein